MKWRGHEIEVVRRGIFKTLIRYKDLFTHLHEYGHNGRNFHVLTSELERENDETE